MKPHCLLCGMELILDDKDSDDKEVDTWWYCPRDRFSLSISYEKDTGVRNIFIDDFSINIDGSVNYG